MNIVIPEKHIIVNSDAQARLLEDDGTAYTAADVSPSAGGFILENFLPLILGSQVELIDTAVRIRLETPSAGAAGVIETEIAVGSAMNAGDVFYVRWSNPAKVPTRFQDYLPLEKRYQTSVAQVAGVDSEDAIVLHLVATINADPNSPVIASQKGGGTVNNGILVLTAKEVGIVPEFYVSTQNAAGGLSVSNPATLTYDAGKFWDTATAGANPVNTYDMLKNIDWARGLDFDRNVEYYPEYGAQYDSYYFQVNWTPNDIGGHTVPSIAPEQQAGRTAFKVWVKEGLTLNTAMDALAADLNV